MLRCTHVKKKKKKKAEQPYNVMELLVNCYVCHHPLLARIVSKARSLKYIAFLKAVLMLLNHQMPVLSFTVFLMSAECTFHLKLGDSI